MTQEEIKELFVGIVCWLILTILNIGTVLLILIIIVGILF